jgi:cell division protease FtsH
MKIKSLGWFLVIVGVALTLGIMMRSSTAQQSSQPTTITTTYDQVQNQLLNSPTTVKAITFVKTGPLDLVSSVQVTLTNGTVENAPVPGEAGSTRLLDLASKTPAIKIDAATEKKPDDSGMGVILSLLISWGPTVLFIGIMIWFLRKMSNPKGQMGKFAQSGANQPIQPAADKKTFADVAGCENAKEELMEIVEFLRNPGQLHDLGGKRTKGALLVGDPGNGKTLLAKAVAGEADVPFFSISGSQFVEMFVGVGASRVRDLFATARPNQPCIIFIDEIDAVGRQRGTGMGGGNDEREQTLNQLLVEMDGFMENDSIVLIAATNRPDILDPALVRPGRFDMQVLVDYADLEGRISILKVHTRKMKLAQDVDLRHVASATPGFSGAQLMGSAQQAALVANRRITKARKALIAQGKSAAEAAQQVPLEVTLNDFDEGVTRVQMGPASGKAMTKEDQENTAYHELGHAYVSQVMHNEGKGGDPVTKITIVARARALGYTQALPKGDRYNYTKAELIARIMMAMGGRAAQEIFLGTVDTGASNDFEQGTNIAYDMVTKYGMSDLGTVHIGSAGANPFLGKSMAGEKQHSQDLLAQVDREWMKIVNQCFADTKALIERDRSCFKSIADVLLAQETILGPQWEQMFNELTCQQKKIQHQDLPPVRPEPCEDCSHKPAADKGANLATKVLGALNPMRLLGGGEKLPKGNQPDEHEGDGEKK